MDLRVPEASRSPHYEGKYTSAAAKESRHTSNWYVDSRIIIFQQANIVFIPKNNSYKRHDRHAVEKKSNEDDDDEDIEGPAVLRTGAWRSLTIFNTLTVEELLQPSV